MMHDKDNDDLIDWTLKHILPKREKPQIIYYNPETMRIYDDGGETNDD